MHTPAVPPDLSGYDPALPVTHTLFQLQQMPQAIAIENDMTVCGIVVMNDKSGNYINKIVIQDATGGIEICMDESHLDKSYPIGRKVYVKCKGLVPGNDNDNLQLGIGIDQHGRAIPIPGARIDDYMVKANYPNPLPADTVSLSTLSSLYTGRPYLNRLVVVRQAEFARDAIGALYAQPSDIASSTNLNLQDCSGGKLILNTSSYALFQSMITPAGQGCITGVYTRNKLTPQLRIRDTADVHFYKARCDGTFPDPMGITSIASIRNLCPSLADSITDLPGYKISGVVISDLEAGNTTPGYLVLQQGERGIVIHFTGTHAFQRGDSVIIDIRHAALYRVNQLLQIASLPITKASKVASGKTVIPRQASITEVLAHYSDWESTLITIPDATITSSGTYSGSKTLNDGIGALTLYTRSAATFAGAWPSYSPHRYTGILSRFKETVQLQLRNLGDVQ